MARIPKNIHLIWVGNNAFPDKYIGHLFQWVIQNPSFQIKLWVDKQGTPADILDKYPERFRAYAEQNNIPDLEKVLDRISIVDITENNVSDEYIRYEIDKLMPNFGAASDILRCRILLKEGGVYFDTDVYAGKKTLEEASDIFDVDYDESGIIYFNHFSDPDLPNDTFICTPNNKVMKQISEEATRNYQADYQLVVDDQTSTVNFLYNYCYQLCAAIPYQLYAKSTSEAIEGTTLLKTGPKLIQYVLSRTAGQPIAMIKGSLPGIRELKNGELRCPVGVSDKQWTGQTTHFQPRLEDTFEKAFKTLKFELQYLKILRLDDHIRQICEAMVIPNSHPIVEKFLNRLETMNIDYNQVAGVQLTYQFDETEQYYRDHGLLDKTFLFPKKDLRTLSYDTESSWIAIKEAAYFEQIHLLVGDLQQEENNQLKEKITHKITIYLHRGFCFLSTLLIRYEDQLKDCTLDKLKALHELMKSIRLYIDSDYLSAINQIELDINLKDKIETLHKKCSSLIQRYDPSLQKMRGPKKIESKSLVQQLLPGFLRRK